MRFLNINTLDEYYVFCSNWSLDSNQWSITVGLFGVFLTFIGFGVAFCIYKKQRNDNAKDSFSYFQLSLLEVKKAVESTIKDLENFLKNLNENNFSNLVLISSLNDKFLDKLNIVDLHRFYLHERKDKIECLKKFLIDSNFIGTYNAYFTNEFNYIRIKYSEENKEFLQWNLLRSNKFFSTIIDDKESDDYKEFYKDWWKDFDVWISENRSVEKQLEKREELKNYIKKLAEGIFIHIKDSEKANEVNMLANKIISSYEEMEKIKIELNRVLRKDIEKFKSVLSNMEKIIE